MPSIEEMKANLEAARVKWQDEARTLADARERAMDALTLVIALGRANTEATTATKVAFAYKGGMEAGGQFAAALADRQRVIISNQATALRSVVAELDKLKPNIESQIETLGNMLGVLGS